MKSYILYGEDQVSSRNRLNEIISKARNAGWEIITLDEKTIDKRQLLTSAKAQTLFGNKQLLILENFISTSKKNLEILKDLIKQGSKHKENNVFVFWEKKEIDGRGLVSLKKFFGVENFKIPQTVFRFLESISPENAQNSLSFFAKAKIKAAPEFLLFMLGRQIRLLIWAKESPDTLTLAPWQKSNLVKQAEKFTTEKLLSLHTKLLELDRGEKTSKLPLGLGASLDLFIFGI